MDAMMIWATLKMYITANMAAHITETAKKRMETVNETKEVRPMSSLTVGIKRLPKDSLNKELTRTTKL